MPAKFGSATIGSMAASGRETEQHRAYDQLCTNTICTLAMDAVQQANSGHPGTPMALAPLVYTLGRIHLGPHVAAA
jgi:transketolase